MDTWIEERCEAIRLALRITEFPDAADTLRLVDWLGANVRLYYDDVSAGSCEHGRDGRHYITLPDSLHEAPLTWEMAHETGHALLTMGMAAILRQVGPETAQVERLARRWELQDERRASDFVLCWFMPDRLVRRIPCDSDLAWQAGVTPEMAYQRRRRLLPEPLDVVGRVPRWSAANEFHAIVRQCGRRVALCAARRGSIDPAFEFPTNAQCVEEDSCQVNADLLALTSREFTVKYADFRVGAAELRPLDLVGLRQWAARGARGARQ